ncbi:MAG: dissimilatory-type sulfite reductase subunit alpha [Chlorobium sp.]|uniref:dissimilatory-type sulfite reductase subunit alpha n=1 Tax=Chlorobium sp. TaxID=1095 RepID=UPI0025C34B6B|nr:dissimilatory-type sulfite reductase subunit alpha [Chlorobium sp.]MCF8383666.1 dissimilatory-type sulfite reductase subunit alpha [Chlorobium sp.]
MEGAKDASSREGHHCGGCHSEENGKFLNPTPMLNELESGPWPSFVSGFKELAERTKKPMLRGVLDQLEYSYNTKMGYWKGGLVTVDGYGAGIITRYSMIKDKFPEAAEFHTMRIQPAPGLHYNTAMMRELCDIWEKYGSGIITLHGQTGDIMLQGIEQDKVQQCFDELNQSGWDLGGAGAGMRTAVSCIGQGRCENACYDNLKLHLKVLKHFVGVLHRPEWNYKLKFKFSGCPNDCTNAIMRSDLAVIGTWRDAIQVDRDEVNAWVEKKGMDVLVNQVINLCPTKAISLKDGEMHIETRDCVRCMHCLNAMPKALSPGKERGISLLMGGKNTLKVGVNMGSLIIPFMKMEDDEDIEAFIEQIEEIIDWWEDAGLDHERIGETIERVGLKQFLDGVGIEADINMVTRPRDNPYFKAPY